MKFRITPNARSSNSDPFVVGAATAERAATKAARVLFGRRITSVNRETGTTGGGGIFAAYRYDKRVNGSHNEGEFHIMEVS